MLLLMMPCSKVSISWRRWLPPLMLSDASFVIFSCAAERVSLLIL